MGKPIRKILSPEIVKACDRILQTHHETNERLIADKKRNEALLRPDGHADVTNREVQQGRVLTRAVLVERLKRLNPRLWYERSIQYPDQGAMYIDDIATPYGKRMVCSFPHNRIAEFSVRLTVPEIIPSAGHAVAWETIRRVDQQIPGWRSVLLRLIKDGIITPSGAEKEFKITQGRSSQKWQEAFS